MVQYEVRREAGADFFLAQTIQLYYLQINDFVILSMHYTIRVHCKF